MNSLSLRRSSRSPSTQATTIAKLRSRGTESSNSLKALKIVFWICLGWTIHRQIRWSFQLDSRPAGENDYVGGRGAVTNIAKSNILPSSSLSSGATPKTLVPTNIQFNNCTLSSSMENSNNNTIGNDSTSSSSSSHLSSSSSRTEMLLPEEGPDITIASSLREEMMSPTTMPPQSTLGGEFQVQSTPHPKCDATCQIKLLIIPSSDTTANGCSFDSKHNNNTEYEHYSWEIQSLDTNGYPKTTGGDEYYVTYTDEYHAMMMMREQREEAQDSSTSSSMNFSTTTHHRQEYHHHRTTAVAEIQDLQNGKYRLKFIESPLLNSQHLVGHSRLIGHGSLSVVLQYTCGIGQMSPPTKNSWNSGGHNVVRQWTIPTSNRFDKVDKGTSLQRRALQLPSPPIHPFQPPKVDNNIIEIFRNAKSIVPLGDSIMQQFVEPLGLKLPNVGMCLNTTTVPKWIDLLQRRYSPKLQANDENIVLLMSSHTWDLLEMYNVGGLEDHRAAIEIFIKYVRDTYPNVQIVWKGPVALHVHVPMLKALLEEENDDGGQQSKSMEQMRTKHRRTRQSKLDRLRYMSSSRSLALHQFQKKVCHDLNIPFLDIYQASYLSADYTLEGDGRHYRANFNTMAVHWFIQETIPEKLFQNYWKSMTKKKKLFRVVVVPSSNTTKNSDTKKDCDLFLDNSSLWAGLVSGATRAMLTNRRLNVVVETTTGKETKQILHCIGDMRNVLTTETTAITEKKIDNGSLVELVLNETNNDRSITPLPTLEQLVADGMVEENTLPHQLAKELFSHGHSFLHGMLLYKILSPSFPIAPQDSTTLVRNHLQKEIDLDLSNNIVLSFYGSGGGDNYNWNDLHSCVNSVVERLIRPFSNFGKSINCHILFPSHDFIDRWKASSLKNEAYEVYNRCHPVVPPGSNGYNDNTMSVFSYAQIIADIAYDGLILAPSTTLSSQKAGENEETFLALAKYLKVRNRGRLPIDEGWIVSCRGSS